MSYIRGFMNYDRYWGRAESKKNSSDREPKLAHFHGNLAGKCISTEANYLKLYLDRSKPSTLEIWKSGVGPTLWRNTVAGGEAGHVQSYHSIISMHSSHMIQSRELFLF